MLASTNGADIVTYPQQRPTFLRLVPPPTAVVAVDETPLAGSVPKVEVIDPAELRLKFEDLRNRSRQLAEARLWEEALKTANEAVVVAQQIGAPEIEALAICNRAGIAFEALTSVDGYVVDLRSILMRNFSAETSLIAAYNLSRAYEIKKEPKKALFYARIARDRAVMAKRADYLAYSHNRIGNSLLSDSYFEEAGREYQLALELLPTEPSIPRVMATTNRAYSLLALGRSTQRALGWLYGGLRWLLRSGNESATAWPHLILSFGHLELGRLRYAWHHGRKALAVAERGGEADAIKMALFLLAEVEKEAGDSEAAWYYIERLQRDFFPGQKSQAELLSMVGIKNVVNLRA